MSAPNELIGKIERFARKYYVNRLIQGTLIGAALWIVFYLLVNALEYFSWFSSKVRLALFLLLILGSAVVFAIYFLIPFINLIRFRKKMSVEQAALLIGRFFPDIQDKLLNTIQLSESLSGDSTNELLLATVEQRTEQLSPIRFSDAVDLKGNKKYLWVFLALLAVLLALVIFLPKFAVQPTQRIVHYEQSFEKPLPYQVFLSSEAIETNQGSDVRFVLRVEGVRIPDAFYVKSTMGQQVFKKESVNDFSYVFKNLFHDLSFQVLGGEYISPVINITVHPNPVLLSYQCRVTYPAYIHRAPEVFEGKTRLLVPQGSKLEYQFSLRDCDSAFVHVDSLLLPLSMRNDEASYQLVASSSSNFDFFCRNAWSDRFDPLRFSVDVLPDAYPDIRVESFDEFLSTKVYYSGLIADDYGFTKLTFNCVVKQPQERKIVLPIVFDRSSSRTSFFHHFDMDSLGILPGQDMEVFFEVWDNDGFHGPKSKRSETFTYYKPSLATLDSVADQAENDIAQRLEDHSKEANQLKDDIQRLLEELTSKKELDWSDKEKIKELVQKQAEMESEWNKLQEEQQQLHDFMKENSLMDEEMLKKQEKINELFDQLIPDDLKKMMEEIERLLDDMPREQMQQMLQDMKKDNMKMQDLLDRNLSLLEQLRMEKSLNELFNELNQLAEELKDPNNDALSADEAKEKFDEMMQRLDSLQEKNQSLNDPFNVQKDEGLEESINQDLEEAASLEEKESSGDESSQEESEDGSDDGSQESGDENQEGESGQPEPSPSLPKSKQKKSDAGHKMQEMANSMMMQMQSGEEEQTGEDAHLVRVLLENVVRSSHQQEALMMRLGKMSTDDPSIVEMIVTQKELTDNFEMIKDSLKAIGMRQPAIHNFIFDELQIIDQQTDVALKNMNDLRFSMSVRNQQVALQSMNNLALMLAESNEEMENSMMGGGGSKKKSKPQQGGKGQQMQSMQQLQEQLGQQLKELRDKMQQQQQGGQMPGMSEEFARMAAEQEMIRQGMQQMLNEMKANGQVGDDGLNQIIKDMEILEEELVNKKINNQMLERNQQILSRMLESQKAQEKRDQDEKRKSNEYKGSKFDRKIDELYYEQRLKKNEEFLKLNPIQYQPYYKSKINEYYIKKNQNP